MFSYILSRLFPLIEGDTKDGKSTVTAGLGLAAAQAGLKVGIIDADLHGFSIPGMLGQEDQPYYNRLKLKINL